MKWTDASLTPQMNISRIAKTNFSKAMRTEQWKDKNTVPTAAVISSRKLIWSSLYESADSGSKYFSSAHSTWFKSYIKCGLLMGKKLKLVYASTLKYAFPCQKLKQGEHPIKYQTFFLNKNLQVASSCNNLPMLNKYWPNRHLSRISSLLGF